MLGALKKTAFMAAIALFATGCSVMRVEIPSEVLEENPVDYPIRALTDFSTGLTCMGRLLQDANVEPIFMTTADLPDRSESVGAAGFGAKEMVISALSRVSEETGVIRQVAYDRNTPNVVALHNSHPQKGNLRIPDFFIRGAVTQIDSSPFNTQRGAGLNIGEDIIRDLLSAGATHSNSVSLKTIALDLNMGLVSNYQILPGVTSTNTMSVIKTGDSTELTVSFTKIGGIFSMNENRADALSHALRALVEVGVIELLGKLYNVNYATCLSPLAANSAERLAIRQEYREMSGDALLTFVANELIAQKFVSGSVEDLVKDGAPTIQLQNGVAAYRVQHGLFPNTAIDYRLFEKMKSRVAADVEALKPIQGGGPIKKWLHSDAQAQ